MDMIMNAKTVIITVMTVLVLILYVCYKMSTLVNISRAQTFEDYNFVDSLINITSNVNGHPREDFLIDTPGCYIRNYAKDLNYGELYKSKQSCGQRAVFIEKRQKNKILFRIDKGKLSKLTKSKKIQCCHQFAKRSTIRGKEDTHISYTSCVPFKDKSVVNLNEEVITVRCTEHTPKEPIKTIIYEDAYTIIKEIWKKKGKTSSKFWNVILVGMPNMSRGRMLSWMPDTAQHLQANKWLEFLGYNKVAWNTYDNFMSLLTGRKLSTINRFCGSNDNGCNELMIWTMFKEAGYVTAYGEDYINLRDTLTKNRFKAPPTDHYMRPFFLTGEKRVDNLICTKNIPSVNHLLNYANDFITSYKDVPHFGSFFINSSQNMSGIMDAAALEFFKKLQNKKLLRNTFVFVVGAHSNNYGNPNSINSYYEERLPVLFVQVPEEFKRLYKTEYHNLELNQDRLTTPYDLYLTLGKLLRLNKTAEVESEACSQSTSLFQEKSVQRTCTDGCIDQNWCSCSNLIKLKQIQDANRSVSDLVAYIHHRTTATPTLPCTKCKELSLRKILRIHKYKNEFNESLHVIAIEMKPGKLVYQAAIKANEKVVPVFKQNENLMILQYNRQGYCIINEEDRPYCVCKTLCDN